MKAQWGTPQWGTLQWGALWQFLKTDPVFKGFLALMALVHAPYFFPFVQEESLSLYTKRFNLIFLPLVAATLMIGLQKVKSQVERRFWRYLIYSLGLWWIPTLTRAFWPEEWRGQGFGLTTDGFFALYYFCWMIAVGLAPHRPAIGTLAANVRRIRSAGTVILIFGLAIYFIAVPLRLTHSANDAWAGSLFLFVILDLILFSRLTGLALSAQQPRWRATYGLLAAGQLMHSYLDLQEGLIYSGLMSWPFGSRLDWIWSLPFLTLVAAARLRHITLEGPARTTPEKTNRLQEWQLGRRSPITFSIFLFPFIHIVAHRFEILDPLAQAGRASVALICLVLLWILANLENKQLHLSLRLAEREHRELEQLRLDQELAERAKTDHNRFVANVSHEIRTPMNGILGMANILLAGSLENEERRHVGILKSAAEGLLQLIDDILDFSKIDAGQLTVEMRRFALPDLLHEVVQLHRPKIEAKGLHLILETAEDLPEYVVGDPLRLRQVLNNLLANASKFTDSGFIVLRVRRPAGETGPGDGDRALPIHFEVQDTGIGIPPEHHGRLFEPFTQVDGSHSRNVGGAGLGLAICRQIVQHQGGRMELQSEVGQGSTFSFTLPMRRARAPRRKRIETPIERLDGKPKILLAEDNPINQMVAVHQLEELGAQVQVAENGEEVLDALEQGSFDLVLMDCQMPRVDGYEATVEIRRRGVASRAGYSIPIVALTAHAFEHDRRRCIQAGMDDYLSKPYTQESMSKILGHWLDPEKDPRLDDSWVSMAAQISGEDEPAASS